MKKLSDTDVGIQLKPMIIVSRKTRLFIAGLQGFGNSTSILSFVCDTVQNTCGHVWVGQLELIEPFENFGEPHDQRIIAAEKIDCSKNFSIRVDFTLPLSQNQQNR
jgi:hypothetical protein